MAWEAPSRKLIPAFAAAARNSRRPATAGRLGGPFAPIANATLQGHLVPLHSHADGSLRGHEWIVSTGFLCMRESTIEMLFRPEVRAARRVPELGEIVLTRPRSFTVLTGLFAFFAVSLCAFFTLGSY